jgi:hypothetical protein
MLQFLSKIIIEFTNGILEGIITCVIPFILLLSGIQLFVAVGANFIGFLLFFVGFIIAADVRAFLREWWKNTNEQHEEN